MSMSEVREKRDLVLPPRSYAYMQDVTKGVIKTYTGPTVINPTAQEVPVVYESATGRFQRVPSLEDAMRWAPVAAEGSYITLLNPAKGNKHPSEGSSQPSDELEVGRKIIIPGPATFALWPEQVAAVVEGHHLRSNQYLLVRVYNEEEARRNWTKAVVKPAGASEGDGTVTAAPPPDLTVGKQLIIRGTEVSFYIPPTGIEVVAEVGPGDEERYVREALTLERLEYAILVDENGKKRYEVGPQVVFPLPTERFVEAPDDAGKRTKKFRAVELSEIQGLHIKVIAPYVENGVTYKAGDELFITGKDTAIYYPREEHSAIKYDGKLKHFATAIPAGEARYLMNRLTGEIATVKGPAMLLPDPRLEVLVRRVLTDRECALWYPGNAEALDYNRRMRALMHELPTSRAGVIAEDDVGKRARSGRETPPTSKAPAQIVPGDHHVGDEFARANVYTPPRTITLDTRFQGAPQISPRIGYAVLVTAKTGARRVEVGPATVLLGYDEGLEILSLSTGKPKTSDTLLHTPYLRVDNNQVSDIVQVETSDHVNVEIHLSYRVSFEGDPLRWFSVENYVKFLCDHIRSVLKGRTRKLRVEEFYATSTDHIRNFILGTSVEGKRPGMLFPENGMRVVDVEVLKVNLQDDKIRTLLDHAQHEVVRTNIEMSTLRRDLELTKQKETIAREMAASELAVSLARIANTLSEIEERKKAAQAQHELEELAFGTRLDREKREREQTLAFVAREQERKIELLKAEAETAVQRFTAASGNFSEALLALSRNETLVKVAQAWDTQKLIEGESMGDTLTRLFGSTPLKPLVDKLASPGPNGTTGKPHAR
jgi:major vault protein